jgi:hypothetical protein
MSPHNTISASGVGVQVDPDQLPHLRRYRWTRNSEGYAVCFDGKITCMHRLVMDAGPGDIVDHSNGNKLDNRRANLLLAMPGCEINTSHLPDPL